MRAIVLPMDDTENANRGRPEPAKPKRRRRVAIGGGVALALVALAAGIAWIARVPIVEVLADPLASWIGLGGASLTVERVDFRAFRASAVILPR